MPVLYTFSTGGSKPAILNLKAKTWCGGERIDLSWSAPTGITVTEYVVKRSRRTFPLYIDDETEVVYTGTALALSETNLEDNTIYYYGVFWTDDSVNYYIGDEGRVAGLSIRDYRTDEGDHWFYERLPAWLRKGDANPGTDQYTLRRYCDVLQCGMALWRGHIESFSLLTDADKMPAGRIGEAVNQYAYLEGYSEQLGFESQRALGVEVMRRVILGITRVRRKKGTCPGLVEFIKLLTGWDGTCAPVSDGACGGGTLFRTWDGTSSLYRGTGVFISGASATLDDAVGQLTDSAAAWTPDLYTRGVLIDFVGNVFCVASNTATQAVFEDPAAQLQYEDAFADCTFSGFGTNTIVITQTLAGMKPFNTSMYDRAYAKVNSGTGKFQITSSTANAAGTTLTLVLSGVTPGAATLLVVADDYLNEPTAFAAREVSTRYQLLDGEHYFLWNPRFDERLRGTARDPFDVLWSGSSMTSVPFSDADVVFWVNAGVASETGESVTVTPTTLTAPPASFTPNALVNSYVNPNRNQTKLFRILANTADTITVEPDADMTIVATSGSFYYVLGQHDAVRFQAVYNTVRRFLPYATRLFVFFL